MSAIGRDGWVARHVLFRLRRAKIASLPSLEGGLMRNLTLAAVLSAGLLACGGGHDVDPKIIPGGGIHDPGIDGEVNVFVIDEDTDAPMADATVRVGTIEGVTDSTGLFVASNDDLTGPQT